MKNNRTNPPSRKRYEESHPIISFRIKKEWYDELKNLLISQDITIADFFKIALKKQKENHDKIWEEGHDNGFCTFNIPCKVCGEPMQLDMLTEPEVEKTMKEAFSKWGHHRCLNSD